MGVFAYGKEEQYKGCVVRTWEHNGYDDSDFYAECLDVENGKTVDVLFDSTRFPGGGKAYVDVTAENYALFLHNGAKQRELEDAIRTAARNAKRIEKGKKVVVVAGRKVAHGVTGEVFWTKDVNYDPYGRESGWEVKIGIKDDDGNVYWTYAKNVNVVDYRQYVDRKKIQKALNMMHSDNYRRLAN